eukprot:363637-Chlamydomonas_euryale.AAC.2
MQRAYGVPGAAAREQPRAVRTQVGVQAAHVPCGRMHCWAAHVDGRSLAWNPDGVVRVQSTEAVWLGTLTARYTLEGTNAAPPVELIRPKIMQLVAMFRGDPARVHLDALWRAFSWLRAGMPEGPPLTKASKLRVSLARYLCDAPQTDVQSLLDLVDTELQADSDVCSAAPASCNISVEQAQELSMEYASTQTPTAK